MANFTYTLVEIGGIQKYILSSGKLKEMIGGSEMIESLGDKCDDVCRSLGLRAVSRPDASSCWYVPVQLAAGSLRLVFPGRREARSFLSAFSGRMLEECPGLPLYGTSVDCEWTPEGIDDAAGRAGKEIAEQRGKTVLAPKSLWPFSRTAPLDGLPAVAKDGEWISAPSRARRNPDLIRSAEARLRALLTKEEAEIGGEPLFPPDIELLWPTDVDELAGSGEMPRIALLHADGNDFGRIFRSWLQATSAKDGKDRKDPEKMIAARRRLSELVGDCTREAFARALSIAVHEDMARMGAVPRRYAMPVRPLVLGGDDLTVVVKASLAFLFADAYAKAFEQATARRLAVLCQESGVKASADFGTEPLSVGIGLVVMQPGYPFSRAFGMAEQLTESAKRLTAGLAPRPSSIDYLVVTNEVVPDVGEERARTAASLDGRGLGLTGKPYLCGGQAGEGRFSALGHFLQDAGFVLNRLPAGLLRRALDECRKGEGPAKKAWQKLRENLMRGLGGRFGAQKESELKAMCASFDSVFPGGFFVKPRGTGGSCTLLGDYLELRQLGLFATKEGK